MARQQAPAALFLALLVLTPPTAAALCGRSCGGAPVALFNATLERCLQRCRDAQGGCERVAHDAAGCCALGPGPGGCGAGWTLHEVQGHCGFGRGRAVGGACLPCAAGSASHAEVGDLAGAWRLRDAGGAEAGRLLIGSGGEARYSRGPRGQFKLWHPRHDPNYPGAFFLEHAEQAAGPGPGWEYAWLEDTDGGTPQLVVRRFCGAGPVACAQLSSPEGSPLFMETLLGERESSGESPCDLLEGVGQGTSGQGLGACCAAAAAVVEVQGQAMTASVEIVGHGHWDHLELVNATWNAPPYDIFQNVSLFFDSSDPLLCSPSTGHTASAAGVTVALARRGGCIFAQKAISAHQSGMQGLIVVNTVGLDMPEFLRNADGATSDPAVPTWMIASSPGVEIMTKLSLSAVHDARVRLGRYRTVDSVTLRNLCCHDSCRERVRYSVANGRGGGIDVTSTCAQVDCSSFVPVSASREPVVLPHANDTCAICPAGLAAVLEGHASCGACGDGQRAGLGGASCEPCPAGSAGLAGQCTPCGTGLVPDSPRRSCIPAATAAPSGPANCPVCPGTGNSGNSGDWPTTTAAPASSGANNDRSQPTIITVTKESGFNWGAMFGAIFSLGSLGGLGWLLRRMYQSYRQTGEVDTLSILQGMCGGLSGFCGLGAAMAAATGVGRAGQAAGQGGSAEAGGPEAEEGAAEEAGEAAAEGRREGHGSQRGRRGAAEEAAEGRRRQGDQGGQGGRAAAKRGGSSQSLEHGSGGQGGRAAAKRGSSSQSLERGAARA